MWNKLLLFKKVLQSMFLKALCKSVHWASPKSKHVREHGSDTAMDISISAITHKWSDYQTSGQTVPRNCDPQPDKTRSERYSPRERDFACCLRPGAAHTLLNLMPLGDLPLLNFNYFSYYHNHIANHDFLSEILEFLKLSVECWNCTYVCLAKRAIPSTN